jgi:predicted DCC family thiol-disulfide oxidoreductase YuxK
MVLGGIRRLPAPCDLDGGVCIKGKRHQPASLVLVMHAEPAIVLYDGACGLCRGLVVKGRRRQRPGAIEWLDSASAEGQALLRRRGLLGREADSLIVVEGDRVSLESAAAVRITLRLRWPWKAAAAVWIVPRPLRDAAYRAVAKRRSRHAACGLPTRVNEQAEPAENRGN